MIKLKRVYLDAEKEMAIEYSWIDSGHEEFQKKKRS